MDDFGDLNITLPWLHVLLELESNMLECGHMIISFPCCAHSTRKAECYHNVSPFCFVAICLSSLNLDVLFVISRRVLSLSNFVFFSCSICILDRNLVFSFLGLQTLTACMTIWYDRF